MLFRSQDKKQGQEQGQGQDDQGQEQGQGQDEQGQEQGQDEQAKAQAQLRKLLGFQQQEDQYKAEGAVDNPSDESTDAHKKLKKELIEIDPFPTIKLRNGDEICTHTVKPRDMRSEETELSQRDWAAHAR